MGGVVPLGVASGKSSLAREVWGMGKRDLKCPLSRSRRIKVIVIGLKEAVFLFADRFVSFSLHSLNVNSSDNTHLHTKP